MKNELRFFTIDQFKEFRAETKDNQPLPYDHGVVYFLEINGMVKIGCSHNPSERLANLISNSKKYFNARIGRIAISQPHNGYRTAERNMHEYFSDCRVKNTELFNVSFPDATAFFLNTDEVALPEPKKSHNTIRYTLEKTDEKLLLSHVANEVRRTLDSPLCYWCVINVPELGEESCFCSYSDLMAFLEILSEIHGLYKEFSNNIKSSEEIRKHLVSQMHNLLIYFSVCVQVDAIDENGDKGIRLMDAGRYSKEQLQIINDIVMDFIPFKASDNATA